MNREKISPRLDNKPPFGKARAPGWIERAAKIEPKYVYAREQALWDALAAGWRRQDRKLATASLEFEFHSQFSCSSSPTGLSDFRQSDDVVEALLPFPAPPTGHPGQLARRLKYIRVANTNSRGWRLRVYEKAEEGIEKSVISVSKALTCDKAKKRGGRRDNLMAVYSL